MICAEIDDLNGRINKLSETYQGQTLPSQLRISAQYYKLCANRNLRYTDSYLHNRLVKIRNLRWETGPVLPESIRHDTLSAREKEYFMQYNSLLTEYNDMIDLDLTADLEVRIESHYLKPR
jgi:GINS complex subunit 1